MSRDGDNRARWDVGPSSRSSLSLQSPVTSRGCAHYRYSHGSWPALC